ncbi:MAG: 30S ribosomal protein S3, partial [Candidatus Aenigmatarchaeota archaeon]
HLEICGEPKNRLVDEAYEEAQTKPGKIGIKVRIMCEYEDITGKRIKPKEIKERAEMLIDVVEKAEKEEVEEI